MCSTCCALGVIEIYCVQQFVFVTVVASRPFGRLGVGGKTVLRRVLTEMIPSSLECLKMVFQTLLKMVIDLRIHQTTENYEQEVGSYMLNREDSSWC